MGTAIRRCCSNKIKRFERVAAVIAMTMNDLKKKEISIVLVIIAVIIIYA